MGRKPRWSRSLSVLAGGRAGWNDLRRQRQRQTLCVRQHDWREPLRFSFFDWSRNDRKVFPALSNDGSVVYIGSSNGVFAVNISDGSERWRFTGATGAIESPITVDTNGHIYFGSNDHKVYALYSDGTLKWSFPPLPTGGDVVAKPAVKGDGTVYAGSKDGKLYAINQFTNPKNRKDLLITSAGQFVGGVPVSITSENDWLKGSSSKGPWSVRLEITRSLTPTNNTYAYNLRAWVRQCNSANCDDALLFDPLGTFSKTRGSSMLRLPGRR